MLNVPKSREILHLRTDTESCKSKSQQAITSPKRLSAASPFKLPQLQKILGEDGTVFNIRNLMNNNTRNIKTRQVQRSFNEVNERKDLNQLTQWTQLMEKQLFSQQYTCIQEFYDKMQLIYSGSIQQLGTLLQSKCSDYWLFLEQVWNTFTKTCNEIIDKQSATNRKLERESLDEVSRLHKMYQVTLDEKSKKLTHAEQQWTRHQEQSEKMDKENKYLRRKVHRLISELSSVKSDLEITQLQQTELIKECETLNLFQKQELKQHHVRRDLTYEQLEEEFQDELYAQKKEIFFGFKRQFEDQTEKYEEAYQKRMRELNNRDDKLQDEEIFDEQQIFFKDQCVGNSFTYQNAHVGTDDLVVKVNQSVQTNIYKKRTQENYCQTQTSTNSQLVQVNFAQIKRECIPRNQDEEIFLEMSKYTIDEHINTFTQLKIAKTDILTKQYNDMLKYQLEILTQRSTQLFGILKMKEEIFDCDFESMNGYVVSSYGFFIQLNKDFMEIINNFKDELISRKIQIFEKQIDSKTISKQRNQTQNKFDLLATKYQDAIKQIHFYQKTIKDAAKNLTQYQVDQMKKKFQRKKIQIELKTDRSNNQQFNTQQQLNSQQQLTSQNSLHRVETLVIPPARQSILLSPIQSGYLLVPEQAAISSSQATLTYIEESSDGAASPLKQQIAQIFPESCQEITDSSSDEEIDLEAHLNPVKNLLSIEKKLSVARCQSKNSQIATQAMMNEISHFRRDKKENLLKLVTLKKSLVLFVQWALKYNKFSYPFHIQLYEYFSIENFQQPQIVWQQKLQRIVKSLIYYKKKSEYAQVFYLIMIGDLQFTLYLQILQNCQQKEFQETAIIVPQNTLFDAISTIASCSMTPSAALIDFDEEMLTQLPLVWQWKLQQLLNQYEIIISIFSDFQRFSVTQFRILLQELDDRPEKWILKTFDDECDEELNGVQYLTFRRFTQLCQELGILQNLADYLKRNQVQYFLIPQLWAKREIELKMMMIRSQGYDAAERDLFNKMNTLNRNDQKIILGRYLERRAKELLLNTYTIECLAPHMVLISEKKNLITA